MDKRDTFEEHYDQQAGKARGVLRSGPSAGRITHSRQSPPADLAPWIAHYWSVSWDLRVHPPHVAETLPHPNVHLVFEDEGVTVSGVYTKRFSKVLEGRSQAFGVKFKPGGFRPFYDGPVSRLANRTVDAAEVFGGTLKQADSVEDFLRSRLPAPDDSVALVDQIVSQILTNPDLRTVDQLVVHTGLGKRSLQRLFSEYVGASPKWVIRRYRLHEALERIHAGEADELAALAVDLGYFDQAHLIRDFKAIVGRTPGEYRALTM